MAQENESGLKGFTAAEAIGAFIRVTLNSSQQIAIAGVDDDGIGTMVEAVESGKTGTVKLWNFPGTRKVVAAAAIAVGANLHCAAAGKFDDATSGGAVVGVALAAASGASSVIEMVQTGSSERGSTLLYANVADSAAITNTTTETDFDKSYTGKAGDLKEGDVLEIEALAKCPATNSTDTLAVKLKVGTETIVATTATDVADNDLVRIKARVTIRAAGASGSVEGQGTWSVGATLVGAEKVWNKAAASEDLSGAVQIKLTATWSVANAGNQVVLQHLSIVRHRKG